MEKIQQAEFVDALFKIWQSSGTGKEFIRQIFTPPKLNH